MGLYSLLNDRGIIFFRSEVFGYQSTIKSEEERTMSEMDMKEGTGTQEETFTQEDIDKNKTIAGLAYIIFFLPLIACPDSRYGRFHANQALILFIVGLAGSIILSFIPIIGWILMPFFSLAVFIFAIIGLINGFGGKAKDLPLMGKIRILK